MKLKFFLFSFVLCLVTAKGFAQKNKEARSIIDEKVSIKKYHNKEELDRMAKGDLIKLYIERNKVLTRILPYVAFATRPGVTMTSLGIPNSSDNRKALDAQFENTNVYVLKTTQFHGVYLPYADTRNLIAAILFYEEIMKSLYQYDQFR